MDRQYDKLGRLLLWYDIGVGKAENMGVTKCFRSGLALK